MYPITETELEECWAALKRFAPKSISWNHYDFAIQTEITDVEVWKAFLLHPDVREWIEEERSIMQDTELAKLTSNVSGSKSVGQAQMISAINRLNDANKTNNATGPAFIYSYVPLTIDQQNAPNVHILSEDIFFVPPTTTKSLDTPAPKKMTEAIDEFKFST